MSAYDDLITLEFIMLATRVGGGGGGEIAWRDIELSARNAYRDDAIEWIDIGGEA